MYSSCIEKQQKVKALFNECSNAEDRYKKIIELGSLLTPIDESFKTEEYRVHGCQSMMYLHSALKEDKVYFEASSDALISKGLAYLLVAVYDGEPPEVILKCPPSFLEELHITSALTPNRANGLYSMHLRMKQDALKLFIEMEKPK